MVHSSCTLKGVVTLCRVNAFINIFRSMLGRISAQSFTFDQDFRPYYGEKFALVRLITFL